MISKAISMLNANMSVSSNVFLGTKSWQNLDLHVQYVSLGDFCARINYYTHCHQLQKQDRDVTCQGSQLALRPLEKKIFLFF